MPSPRADYACLSKKCFQDGAATVYMDLPSTSTRCPVCGSKRFQKIMACNVATRGVAPFVDAALERFGLPQQLEAKDRALAAATKDAHDRPRPGDAVVAGHAGNLGALMAKATAPWAGNAFAGASAGPAKAATLGQGVVLGQRLPQGGVTVTTPDARVRLAGGARPDVYASDGKGRPVVR